MYMRRLESGPLPDMSDAISIAECELMRMGEPGDSPDTSGFGSPSIRAKATHGAAVWNVASSMMWRSAETPAVRMSY
jgi:hypothetical protein